MLNAHYDSWIRGAPIVIAASGKFNPDRIASLFEKVKRPAFKTRSPSSLSYQAPRAPRIAEVKKNREQSHLIVGFSGTRANRFRSPRPAASCSPVLGGQSGRLFTELRDKKGLCYTVAPISFEGIEPGYIAVDMGVTLEARSGARRNPAQLEASPQAGLGKRAQARQGVMLARHHMDMQMNSAIANSAAFNTLYGRATTNISSSERSPPCNALSVQKLAARIFDSPSITALVV